MKFKIQGAFIKEEKRFLFWSNNDGWVDFDSATTFDTSESFNLPIDNESIALLGDHGSIIGCIYTGVVCGKMKLDIPD